MNHWPSGEEAMDMRFEVLRTDIINLLKHNSYLVSVAGNLRPKPQLPDRLELADAKLFDRIGQPTAAKRGGKYYDEMTPEQVNKRMRAFAMKAQGKPK